MSEERVSDPEDRSTETSCCFKFFFQVKKKKISKIQEEVKENTAEDIFK